MTNSTLTNTATITQDTSTGGQVKLNLASSFYSITSSATTLVQRDTNQNAFANNFTSAVTNVVSATGNTVLTVASARYQNLTGTQMQTFQLPDATTLSLGAQYQFNNNSTGFLVVLNNSLSNIVTVPTGGLAIVIAVGIGTSAGTWDTHIVAPSNTLWSTSGLQLGGTDAASPATQFLQVQNVVAGTSNTAGADFTVQGSLGTGTGIGGDIVFKAAPAGSTGTSQNAAAEVLRISHLGTVKFSNAASFSANGSVGTTLGSVGPTGAQTTVQKWLTFVDNGGATRYVPCF